MGQCNCGGRCPGADTIQSCEERFTGHTHHCILKFPFLHLFLNEHQTGTFHTLQLHLTFNCNVWGCPFQTSKHLQFLCCNTSETVGHSFLKFGVSIGLFFTFYVWWVVVGLNKCGPCDILVFFLGSLAIDLPQCQESCPLIFFGTKQYSPVFFLVKTSLAEGRRRFHKKHGLWPF